MKRFAVVLAVVLLLAVPAFAIDDINGGIHHNGYTYINDGSTNNSNSNSNRTDVNNSTDVTNENTNININKGNRQGQLQGQMQGQLQGQLQGQINEGNKLVLINERPFMLAPNGVLSELNFGNGSIEWGWDVLKFDILNYNGEPIIEVINHDSNVRNKSLIAAVLKLIKKESPLCYNYRLLISKKQAQKTYNFSIAGVPAGAGVLGTTGVAGSATIGPSVGGTKANDLYDLFIVRIK